MKIKKGDILIDKYGTKYKYVGKYVNPMLNPSGFNRLLINVSTRHEVIVTDGWFKEYVVEVHKAK